MCTHDIRFFDAGVSQIFSPHEHGVISSEPTPSETLAK